MAGLTPPLSWLPVDDPVELRRVDDTWSALSLPTGWADYTLELVGVHAGPVFVDPSLSQHVWILAPGALSQWPNLESIGVYAYGPGSRLLVPAEDGYHDGTRWLRPPLNRPLTDPLLLRTAMEFVIGPLGLAAEAGPVVLCQHCRAPIRKGRMTNWFMGASGPFHATYACERCWDATAAGGGVRHLHSVHDRGQP